METSEDYKQLIEAELKKEQPDWQLIEKISRSEVDSDPLKVRFSVDAAHIQRLGMELVAKQETALVELIKNAYDAEATRVNVTFFDSEKPGGTLVIEDDGIGMSLEIIRDAWMRISTVNKRDNPVSENFGRVRAGRKGIGRFAVQRLGEKLILETESHGSTEGLRVTFDWDNTFTDGKPLSDIFNNVERYSKAVDSQLTRLTIYGLRENWTPAAMQRAWKAILLLQPPFKLANPVKHNDPGLIKTDPGFEVTINGITGTQQRTAISLESAFLDHAIAEIQGEIDEHGNVKFSIKSSKLDLIDSYKLDDKLLLTGPVKFSTKYFIYSAEALSGMSLSTAQEMAKNYGGIRIYRNGFRVLPYGERYDDWLALDQDSSRRVLLIPATNRNFFGHVEIDAVLNPSFEETSSREGIIENDAFSQLTYFVRAAIEWGAKRVAEARHRKVTAGQRDFVSTVPVRKPSEIITSLIDSSEASKSDSSDTEARSPSSISPETLAAVKAEVEAWEEAVEIKQAESLKYEEMLRILASLGLSITVFGHEIKGIRSSVAGNIVNLSRLIESLEAGRKQDLLREGIGWMETATDRMFDLGGYIAGLMSSTESRELRSQSIKGVIERFMDQFSQYVKRQHITFTSEIKQESLRTTEMHSSEIDSILLNLMTNSIKAIKKSKSPTRKIHISAFEEKEQVVIRFEDNGTGVEDSIAHRIFDPFFTTTIGSEEDSVAGPGTGLGLKIISDIAQNYGGSAALAQPTDGFNCCFEIRIKAAQRQGTLHDL